MSKKTSTLLSDIDMNQDWEMHKKDWQAYKATLLIIAKSTASDAVEDALDTVHGLFKKASSHDDFAMEVASLSKAVGLKKDSSGDLDMDEDVLFKIAETYLVAAKKWP